MAVDVDGGNLELAYGFNTTDVPWGYTYYAAFFYAIFIVVWLIFVAIIYSVIESMGVFDAAEDLGRALVLVEEVNITLGMVEKWALLKIAAWRAPARNTAALCRASGPGPTNRMLRCQR